MQVQRPLHQLSQIDRSFARSRRPREVHQVLNNPNCAASLLLQRLQLFSGGVRQRRILQQLAHPKYAGERIVQFVRESADHLAHRGQAFALDDLFFELFLNCNVTYRYDHAAHFAFSIEQRAGRGTHGSPTAVAMARPVLAGIKQFLASHQLTHQSLQFGRVILFLQFFPLQFLTRVAKEVTHSRAHKAVGFIRIDYEDQIGETFQQIALKLFLPAESSFHFTPFGDIDQCALIANDLA